MKHKVLDFMKSKKYSRIKVSIIFVLFLFTISLGTSCFSYLFTNGNFDGSSYVTVPSFDPRVNTSADNTQTVSLSDTINNNKSFAPGAEGKFKIDIDFTNVGYDSYYKVTYDRTGIPNNLKFYIDEDYETELDYLEGVTYKNYENRVAEHYIYWKWIIDDSAVSNENDSLYMGQEVTVSFTSYISQIVEKNTIIINDIERSTGRIDVISTHEGNNRGSFDITLDLSNVTANSQYRVYFNEKELSSNLHLYSDSSYQNEINYIQGTYDGENDEVTSTVYWKLETDNISTLSSGLYYAVTFGSW